MNDSNINNLNEKLQNKENGLMQKVANIKSITALNSTLGASAVFDDLQQQSAIEYQIIIKPYKKLVSEIANLIDFFKIKDSLEIAMFYRILYCNYIIKGKDLMKQGKDIFSHYYDIVGAGAVCENAVCRHISKNLVDIYRKLGLISMFIPVKMIDASNQIISTFSSSEINSEENNHAVIAVVSKRGKFIIDPMNSLVANFECSEKKNKNLVKTVGSQCYFFITQINDEISCFFDDLNNQDFERIPNAVITEADIIEAIKRSYDKFLQNYTLIQSFKENNRPLIDEISYFGNQMFSQELNEIRTKTRTL